MTKAQTLIILVAIFILGIAVSSITQSQKENNTGNEKPTLTPEGILVKELPREADIVFVSIRYVLDEVECLDNNYKVKDQFLNDADCLQKIYDPDLDSLASPRQLYSMDIETGETVQLTNINYDFSSSKIINSTTIMAIGSPFNVGLSVASESNIYLINLESKSIQCLTCELDLTSINNPDYSPENDAILFSVQRNGIFHNWLFILDLDDNLMQLTSDEDYMDFDCGACMHASLPLLFLTMKHPLLIPRYSPLPSITML